MDSCKRAHLKDLAIAPWALNLYVSYFFGLSALALAH